MRICIAILSDSVVTSSFNITMDHSDFIVQEDIQYIHVSHFNTSSTYSSTLVAYSTLSCDTPIRVRVRVVALA
jgi:hypothetical protein